ncbi:hypothetical protein M422DRAFT_84154, partial [Sphaerobolus stellatus SS14]
DGEDTTVDPGWESTYGIVNDIFSIQIKTDTPTLSQRFTGDPYFIEVIEWLEGGQLTAENDAKSRRQAQHRARDFMIEEGKLWRVVRGRQAWRAVKVECIPEEEAYERAMEIHVKGGHFAWDLMVLDLQQSY